MIRYQRPAQPAGFATDVAAEQGKVTAAIHPVSGQTIAAQWKGLAFPTKWSKYKDEFNTRQHNKCCYCERKYTGHGDVEHFKPKKQVMRLDADGVEQPSLRVKGRSERDPVVPGYWWLAYEWANYLFSCSHCNSKWKSNFVEVTPPHTSTDVPTQARVETFALLNPFDDDPEDHMVVEPDGMFRALTDRGQASIRILGLNRPSLVELRKDVYEGAHARASLHLSDGVPTIDQVMESLHPKHPHGAARRAGVEAGLGSSTAVVLGLVHAAVAASP